MTEVGRNPNGRLTACVPSNCALPLFLLNSTSFHSALQDEPAYCGLATLSMVLNALSIDPGRQWRGPWRWFSEAQLDCCIPLEVVKTQGITLMQVRGGLREGKGGRGRELFGKGSDPGDSSMNLKEGGSRRLGDL